MSEPDHDPVNHPRHYTAHPSGVEAIEVTRLLPFDIGNAVKYVWRADLKNGTQDYDKALWYLDDALAFMPGPDPRPQAFLMTYLSLGQLTRLLAKVVDHEPKPDHRIFYRHIAAGDIVRARVLVESIVGDPDA
ncbi:hypothetical protein SEA_CAIB_53 [Gordonia phage CaiB]|nr:hypothetical protein SEA_CAIB_53 [Gordonia phage CaiB]